MRVSVKAWPSCVSVTLAPEMTAPEPSLMVPRIVPVSTWAKAVAAETHRHTTATAVRAPLARERMPTPFFAAMLSTLGQSFDRLPGRVKRFFSYGMTLRPALAVLVLAAAGGPETARFVDV